MAGASLLALLDDIASILDDVAAMTKTAAKKTAGVLGDDLALNAQQVGTVAAERELPVVWKVAIGSLKNKAILVPAALAASALLPWLVTPLLMLGGLYLCFEGMEKLAGKFLHGEKTGTSKNRRERVEGKAIGAQAARHIKQIGEGASTAQRSHPPAQQVYRGAQTQAHDLTTDTADLEAHEAEKIRGAIRTDFVLSAEIIVIALGSVAGKPFPTQILVLVGIGILMTAGVYGIVAAIVKMDDLGLHLASRRNAAAQRIGRALLVAAPRLMKALTVVGTAAMFLVGGGILLHGLPALSHPIEHWASQLGWLGTPLPALTGMLVGVAAGTLALCGFMLGKRMTGRHP
ncbi:MAG: DUF808 domain-containing protein [Rhodocyclaceae bacterium]